MIKLNYVKLGTQPYGAALVRGKRKMPIAGDKIQIRLDNGDKNLYSNPWKWVQVDSINENCVFVHEVSQYE